MGCGNRRPAAPLVEPVAVQETVATGCVVRDDGTLVWIVFYAERSPEPGAEAERVVTARVCVPSAQFPRLKRMLGVTPEMAVHFEDGAGVGHC